MCIHCYYNRKERKWIPMVDVKNEPDKPLYFQCKFCGRNFSVKEYLMLNMLFKDLNSSNIFSCYFAPLSVPVEKHIESILSSWKLD